MKKCDAVEILLVEDNLDDAELMLRGFKKFNLVNHLHVIHTGKEAIKYIFESNSLRLVILDLNLPDMGGLDVLKRIRRNPKTKRIPIVILTIDNEDHHIQQGYDLGANSYIVKPVDFIKFSQVVSALGFYWMLINKGVRNLGKRDS